MVAKAKSKAKAKPKMTDKIYTNSDLARLNNLFKSDTVGDLQVSYKTYMAIKAIAKQVSDALVTVVDVQNKYVADGLADELYQEFIAAQNEIRKDKPDNMTQVLTQHAEDYKGLVANQVARTADFQALFDADSGIKIKCLTAEDYPDLYAAELAASEWETLSLVLE